MERLTIALRKREDVVALRWPERTRESLSVLKHCGLDVEGENKQEGLSRQQK
jgi:hypothetical protein